MTILWDSMPAVGAQQKGFPTWRVALDALQPLREDASSFDAAEQWQRIVEIAWLAFEHLPGAQAGDLQDEALNQFRSRRFWDFPSDDEISDTIETVAAKHGVSID